MVKKPTAPKPSAAKKRMNRDLVLKALTDRKFRKSLEEAPQVALGKKVTDIHLRELSLVLATVKGLEAQIAAIGDELLCLNGHPCGIA
jgi:hypothetical protein